MAAFELSPAATARNLLGPAGGQDSYFARLAYRRSMVGLIATMAISSPYIDPISLATTKVYKLQYTVLQALAAIALSVVFVVGVTYPERRRDVLRQWREPASCAAAFALTIGPGWFVVVLWRPELSGPQALVLILPLLWYFVFLIFAFWYTARYLFRVSALHPMMGPIAGSLTVLSVVVRELLFGDSPVPESQRLTIMTVGLVSSLGLATWEVLAMRRRGIGLRTGPLPVYRRHSPSSHRS